jgi:hypothetical protein
VTRVVCRRKPTLRRPRRLVNHSFEGRSMAWARSGRGLHVGFMQCFVCRPPSFLRVNPSEPSPLWQFFLPRANFASQTARTAGRARHSPIVPDCASVRPRDVLGVTRARPPEKRRRRSGGTTSRQMSAGPPEHRGAGGRGVLAKRPGLRGQAPLAVFLPPQPFARHKPQERQPALEDPRSSPIAGQYGSVAL